MGRPRNYSPRFVSFDMDQLDNKQATMNDTELGQWFRAAIRDIRSGCVSENVDEYVKQQFERAMKRMRDRQQIDSKIYSKAKAGERISSNPQKTAPEAATIRKNVENDVTAQPLSAAQLESGTTSGAVLDLSRQKHAYGENKHVMLTIEEGQKLRESYGADLGTAIQILDDYITNRGKQARRYKSHFAVLRRNNWVWQKVQELKITNNRLNNTQKTKSFQQQDAEAKANLAQQFFLLEGVGG